MEFRGDAGAIFSDCGKYRYALWRKWDMVKPLCMFIGLNPSTADATTDDPTIRRCIGFAKRWGYGGMLMGNRFAYRSTDPKQLRNVSDCIGPDNDYWNGEMQARAGLVIVAWGNEWGSLPNARPTQRRDWYALGFTASLSPRHPLYLRADTQPTLWRKESPDA